MRCSGKPEVLAVAAMLLLAGILAGASDHWEIAIGYGSWSLAPFTPLLENRATELIEGEVAHWATASLPSFLNLQQTSRVAVTSSGTVGSLSLWYHFTRSRFSLGAEAGMVHWQLPLSTHLHQSATFLGVEVAAADTQGTGQLEVEAVACSLLGRWEAVKARRFSLSLEAGCSLLPFSGRMSLDLTTKVKSVLGDDTFHTQEERSISQLREEFPQTPSLIVAPVLLLSARYRFLRRLGIAVEGGFFHGSLLRAALFFSL